MRFTTRFRPASEGIKFVKDIVDGILSPSRPVYLSGLGLRFIRNPEFFKPRSESCLVEQAFAAYRTFPQLRPAFKNQRLDLAVLMKMLEDLDIFALNIWEPELENLLNIHVSGVEACYELLKTKETVTYPYVGEGQPIAMHAGQKLSEIRENLRLLLKKVVLEYQLFLKTNELQFLGQDWFDHSLIIVFVVRVFQNETVSYDEYFVEYSGSGERVKVVDGIDVDLSKFIEKRTVIIKKKRYLVHSATQRAAPTQLFTYTPLRDFLLRMLNDAVKNYFKKRMKDAAILDSTSSGASIAK